MQKQRIIIGSALAISGWTVLASFTYCLGFSHFDLGQAFARFRPPYCQWFEVAWYWLTYDTSERVQFWLIVGAAVPTISAVLMVFSKFRNNMPTRRLSRQRWPWEDDSRRIP